MCWSDRMVTFLETLTKQTLVCTCDYAYTMLYRLRFFTSYIPVPLSWEVSTPPLHKRWQGIMMPINRFHLFLFPILTDQIATDQEFMPVQAVIIQAACRNRENLLNASRAGISISTVYINLLQQRFPLKSACSKRRKGTKWTIKIGDWGVQRQQL